MARTLVSLTLLSLVCAGCKSQGTIEGELSTPESPQTTETKTKQPMPKPAAAKHEHVSFTWESTEGSHSGTMKTTLPDGEAFSGQFHEITAGSTVDALDGFYGAWYGGPWAWHDWTWAGDWPYYPSAAEYITYYTDHVVAMLDGDRGTSMRCRFRLDDSMRGLKGGGTGHCQLSSGDWITAIFAET